MLDNGIKHLDRQAQSRSLDTLESDVWAGIDDRVAQSRTSKMVTAWQSGVLALALVTSIGMGAHAGANLPDGTLGVFSPHASLSPSTLLGGH